MKPISKCASDEDIMLEDSATLKFYNQKNGWKGVCIHQSENGKKSCVEFVPLGFATVTPVKLQAAIGKYGYQHIGTIEKLL